MSSVFAGGPPGSEVPAQVAVAVGGGPGRRVVAHRVGVAQSRPAQGSWTSHGLSVAPNTRPEVRPVYHRFEQRVRSHVARCWLALLLVGVATVKTSDRWLRLRRRQQSMHLVRYRTTAGTLARRTVTALTQR